MKKVAIVTGASRGIGAATARLAARAGYAVCVNYVSNRAAAANVVAEIGAAGGEACAVQADVALEPDVLRLFDESHRALGPVTALVNNAGILETKMRLDQMEVDRLHRVMNANVIGAFICAREAVRRMSTRHGGKGGAIVNVGSAASRIGSPDEYIDYAASKGAVDTLTLGLAKEVATEGIRVNCVRPGPIYTDIHASGGEPDRIERIKSAIPMKRGGDAAEIAHAIVWLLSDEASYCTGALLDVSGGR
jgi:NAD(P)-dependent dehydrogenase (short-subunit alcohol dehydrogenase family)